MQDWHENNKGQYTAKGLLYVAKLLDKHPSKSVVLFCNSWRQSQHFCDHLEQKLNELKLNLDVIHINGSLHKIDKFWCICLFCDEAHISNFDFRVLITTNTANIGIDKASIALQMWFDWPQDLLTYFQEHCCGLHHKGIKSSCILYADLSSYVILLSQLIRGTDEMTNNRESAPDETWNGWVQLCYFAETTGSIKEH